MYRPIIALEANIREIFLLLIVKLRFITIYMIRSLRDFHSIVREKNCFSLEVHTF